jgi:hypothetical protein
LKLKADAFAKRVIFGAFTVAFGQLIGMGNLIYITYSWDTIEPITYLVTTFYATVGMGFFMRYGHDWEYTSVYDMFKTKKLNQLCEAKNFD